MKSRNPSIYSIAYKFIFCVFLLSNFPEIFGLLTLFSKGCTVWCSKFFLRFNTGQPDLDPQPAIPSVSQESVLRGIE